MLACARIDERLIHGQVATSWLPAIKPNLLLVIDDETANDAMQSMIVKAVAPPGLKTEILTVQKAIPLVKKHIDNPKTKLFLLFKGPEAVVQLQEAGIEIKTVNLGNIYQKPGRTAFHKTTYLTDGERDSFRQMIRNGAAVHHQVYVNDAPYDIKSLL